MRILVAGATGRLGMRLVRRLRTDGHRIRILARDAARVGLLTRHASDVVQADLTREPLHAGVCRDIDLVVSCAGASTSLFDVDNCASFEQVNHLGNARLLRAARAAGVPRFLYVAPLGAERLVHTAYGAAHERFVAQLRGSGMRHTVVRATGYFSFIAEAMRLVHAGAPWLFGAGPWRTNPVHEGDLADFCAMVIAYGRHEEITVGGPDTFTRHDIHDMARRTMAAATRPFPGAADAGVDAAVRRSDNARLNELLQFGSAVSRLHVVGTACGVQRLPEYLEAVAATWRPRRVA